MSNRVRSHNTPRQQARKQRRREQGKALASALEALEPAEREMKKAQAGVARAEQRVMLLIRARDVLHGGTQMNGNTDEPALSEQDFVDADDQKQFYQAIEEVAPALAEAKLEYAQSLLDFLDLVEKNLDEGERLIHPPSTGDVVVAEESRHAVG
jgi:hypothetical protein